jgi:CBS domain-containing protein
MQVRDLMTPSVLTASTEDPVPEVDRAMRERGVQYAVITDGEAVCGLLTEKELSMAENNDTVGMYMKRDPSTIAPDASLADAALAMAEHNQRYLPVIDGAMMVGIVSMNDIRSWARKTMSRGEGDDEAQRVLTLEVGKYQSQSPRT